MSVSANAEQVVWVEVPIANHESVFHGRAHFYRIPLTTPAATDLYNQLLAALFS